MRYTTTLQVIDVIGTLWMPGITAAMRYTLSEYDMHNLGDPAKVENVELWVIRNSGDFQCVLDFRADFDIVEPSGNATRHIVHDWQNEESEMTYDGCMYPQED